MIWLGTLALFVFALVAAFAIGSLTLLSFDRLVDTRWMSAVRPTARLARFTWAPLALLLAALAVLGKSVYPWIAAPRPHGAFVAFYLQPAFFFARIFADLVAGVLFYRLVARPGRGRGAAALTGVFFIASFFFFDALMTRQTPWASSGFGAVLFASSLLIAFAVALWRAPGATPETRRHLNSLHLALIGAWAFR